MVRPLVANTVGSISGKGSLSRCRAIWAARAEAASPAEDRNEDCNSHNNAPAASVSVAAKTGTAATSARTRTPLWARRFGDRRTPIVVCLPLRVSATVSRCTTVPGSLWLLSARGVSYPLRGHLRARLPPRLHPGHRSAHPAGRCRHPPHRVRQGCPRGVRVSTAEELGGGANAAAASLLLRAMVNPFLPRPTAVAGLPRTLTPPICTNAERTRWLFPGRRAGQPMHPDALAAHIDGIGIPTVAGRAAAIRQHILEMPAPVVADALGYHRSPPPSWRFRPEAPGAGTPPETTYGHHRAGLRGEPTTVE